MQELEVGAVAFFRRFRTLAHGDVFLMIMGWRHRNALDAVVGLQNGPDGPCICLESGVDADGMPVFQSLGLAIMLFMGRRCTGCSAFETEVGFLLIFSYRRSFARLTGRALPSVLAVLGQASIPHLLLLACLSALRLCAASCCVRAGFTQPS